jgi:membrane dipeptidase
MIVDLAHTNRLGFMQACDASSRPLIVSHTGLDSVFHHWRNIDDEQVRAVARTGGVVGVIFVPRFLGQRNLEAVVAHLKRVIDVGGEDCAALGSDWDGMVVPTPQLRDVSLLPHLTCALLKAGLSTSQVRKVLRENVMRVLRAHDLEGAQMQSTS